MLKRKPQVHSLNPLPKSKQKVTHPDVITLTFGDVAESHVGMEKLGTPTTPLTVQQLQRLHKLIPESKLHILNGALPSTMVAEEAAILVLPNMLSTVFPTNEDRKELKESLLQCEWDKKARMRGRVVTKRARYNLVFGDTSQDPVVEEGKGRVIAFNTLPELAHLRKWCENVVDLVSPHGPEDAKPKALFAEGNFYFHSKAGIGFHGDAERNIVIGVRIGGPLSLVYQWYHRSTPIGKLVEFSLNDGDIYIMSGKAIGSDWKKSSLVTLRHAAGASKYTHPPPKKVAKS